MNKMYLLFLNGSNAPSLIPVILPLLLWLLLFGLRLRLRLRLIVQLNALRCWLGVLNHNSVVGLLDRTLCRLLGLHYKIESGSVPE